MPCGRRAPKRGHVTITFGSPLAPAEEDDYDSFIARVERSVRKLAGPKGIAVDPPPGGSRSEGPNYWY